MRGTLTMSLDAEQGTSEQNIIKSSSSAQQISSSHYSFTPSASYTFSDNITGKLSYSASQKKEESSTTTSNIFSLSVKVDLK
jgi:hypothetical protein